ncbi:unnamed protein product [Coffea canephora]|uniref:Uncharacterized protein n=1 Tax=Coffea canephora TaxID=49390 RepID=A0A068UXE1_COFCA|nr:unnamed protein product [Coffea canephora]
MSEGNILDHGPRSYILEVFESWGFMFLKRKGIVLQELFQKRGRYWYDSEESYNYIFANTFSRKFEESLYRKKLSEQLSTPLVKY